MDVLEAGGEHPFEQMASGVRLTTVGAGHRAIHLQPAVDGRVVGMVRHGPVVGVAHRDVAARSQHPSRLAEGRHRVGEMLEQLVGVHHVETRRRERQRVHVGQFEAKVVEALLGGIRGGVVDGGRSPVDADYE